MAKARKAAQRLVDVAFRNVDRTTGEPIRPVFSIPADEKHDDDLIIMAALDALARLQDRSSEAIPLDAWTGGADDRPLPEDEQIKAAHPTRSERHDLFAEAMRLVGARRSKYGLVGLVTWLLLRIEREHVSAWNAAIDKALETLVDHEDARIKEKWAALKEPSTSGKEQTS